MTRSSNLHHLWKQPQQSWSISRELAHYRCLSDQEKQPNTINHGYIPIHPQNQIWRWNTVGDSSEVCAWRYKPILMESSTISIYIGMQPVSLYTKTNRPMNASRTLSLWLEIRAQRCLIGSGFCCWETTAVSSFVQKLWTSKTHTSIFCSEKQNTQCTQNCNFHIQYIYIYIRVYICIYIHIHRVPARALGQSERSQHQPPSNDSVCFLSLMSPRAMQVRIYQWVCRTSPNGMRCSDAPCS